MEFDEGGLSDCGLPVGVPDELIVDDEVVDTRLDELVVSLSPFELPFVLVLLVEDEEPFVVVVVGALLDAEPFVEPFSCFEPGMASFETVVGVVNEIEATEVFKFNTGVVETDVVIAEDCVLELAFACNTAVICFDATDC